MRILEYLILASIVTFSAFGQGGFTLNTFVVGFGVGPAVDAPVSLADGSAPGPSMTVGVYVVREGGLELIGNTQFRTSPGRENYVVGHDFAVPGVPIGASATFRVRVWPAVFPTFEAAVEAGACYGEFPTVAGNGEAHIEVLGDPDPSAPGHPVIIPHLPGLLPLELPCVLASGSTSNLVPVVKVNGRQTTDAFRLEVLTGFVDQTTLVQVSTNLVSWFNIASNNVFTNRFVIEEPLPSQETARWYRAIVPD